MKMKKMIFLMLLSFLGVTTSMNAQVRIGGTTDPDKDAILDLNSDAGNATSGFLPPRVKLTARNNPAPLSAHVAGMIVYNTATVTGTPAVAVAPGLYINDGVSWAPVALQGQVKFAQQPALQWVGLAGEKDATFEVVIDNSGAPTYQWFKRNEDGSSTQLPEETNATLTIAAGTYTEQGLYSGWYCVVTDGDKYGVSNIGLIVIGCGAKTNTGGWLKFQCWNLGADTSLDPFTWKNDGPTVDNDIKGYLFQWGRQADGHQLRSSEVTATTEAYAGKFDANGQIPSSATDYYGKFIKSTATPYDWRTPQDNSLGTNPNVDPCRTQAEKGWRLPTQDEWSSIFNGGTTPGNSETASANVWTWTNRGFAVKPDGTNPTLFLPAAGRHARDLDPLSAVGESGYYWSSETSELDAYVMSFGQQTQSSDGLYRRANALSVRCVEE
jgi:uncharacterized protein (TIGR02145 family)